MKYILSASVILPVIMLLSANHASGQQLERQLQTETPASLAEAAQKIGDARRGAIVFHQQSMACVKCHKANGDLSPLGPKLTQADPNMTATQATTHLIESVLDPSKTIKKGFESVTIVTADGESIVGFIVEKTAKRIVIRDVARDGKLITILSDDVDKIAPNNLSVMPAGQVNQLASRQQFLDLIRYLIEIKSGGAARARELQPPPALLAARPLPEYEKRVDHAGMIGSLDQQSFRRGEAIYKRLCINCHGTRAQPGSLPTSLRFAEGKFKNGSDPYSMYQTLTQGFGMMAGQSWMVPQQKYDVIHYVRQAYLKSHNPTQLTIADEKYLATLPKGDTRGPAPSKIEAWTQMDYGPNLVMTLEIGRDARNFAYKGNAVRLDAGPGGITKGRYWMVYDYDTLRVAAAWSGKDFCDFNGINFNGQHNIHPRLVGKVHLANPTGPGWGRPSDGSFEDVRLVGRDKRIYGPLPRDWAHYKGMYYHGDRTIVEYTVGDTKVLETPSVVTTLSQPVFTRTFNIGPRSRDLLLQVAHRDETDARLTVTDSVALFGPGETKNVSKVVARSESVKFGGRTRVDITNTDGIHVNDGDFTITARIKTKSDGTLVAQTPKSLDWVPNGLTWFISGGRLTVDIGWVGAFRGQRRVADGKWHDVAMSYEQKSGTIQFHIDGKPEKKTGQLKRKAILDEPILRIGQTSKEFPQKSFYDGQIAEVRYYNKVLSTDRIAALAHNKPTDGDKLAGHWKFATTKGNHVVDISGGKRHGTLVQVATTSTANRVAGTTIAGFEGDVAGITWQSQGGDLRLKIPAGKKPIRFTLWFAALEKREAADQLLDALVLDTSNRDLSAFTQGGPARWPQVLKSEAILGDDSGPFAVDVLRRPTDNPWFCRMRLTGLDFTPDGRQAVVSAWDGSIWLVSGLGKLPKKTIGKGPRTVPITWRRIASGLFQPLGLKIVKGKIYVTCRDQLCVLHDLNGDGEIDYYESFNNDHQVTDHFHEFAMGLQADEEGNFYYAKSARHALTAVVPHHGTLLRISKDGLRTDILAKGFRAANGVCLNPDGTFIVTDQEGHWNPKNRINYVKIGGFYGNMFGYHDVTDSSDSAMQQPLCWITNSFDRSPAELLWVKSKAWGPLDGTLLNLSYGYGKVYVVPHEKIKGQVQGGMCELPIARFPTGVMRGRFHPDDGQLYLCGMFAWAGNQTQPGGLYRLRYTGKPVYLPVKLKATSKGMSITMSDQLDAKSVADVSNYDVKVWALKRTRNYGSKHYNEHALKVTAARLDRDGRTIRLEIPKIGPTWCMEIRYRLRTSQGKPVVGKIHNTIHNLGK